jgi:hypothetical protein
MLLGQSKREEELQNDNVETEEPPSPVEEVYVSMYISSNPLHSNTTRFKGQIGTTSIFTLIDSESIHSFINLLFSKGNCVEFKKLNS